MSHSRIFSRLDGPVGERSDVSARPLILFIRERARACAPPRRRARPDAGPREKLSFTPPLISVFLTADAAPPRLRPDVVSALKLRSQLTGNSPNKI